MSCELVLKQTAETNPPTGGTQHREYWGGPTTGRANTCRRRLAAVELAEPPYQWGGGIPLGSGPQQTSPAPFAQMFPLLRRHRPPHFRANSSDGACSPARPSAPIISFIPIHLLRCITITPAAATTDLLLPFRPTATATATSRCPGPRCQCSGEAPLGQNRTLNPGPGRFKFTIRRTQQEKSVKNRPERRSKIYCSSCLCVY